MPNHVHLVLVPNSRSGLADALTEAHRSYSWSINRRNGWQGHLWQERFFSCPMDGEQLRSVIRYVELNPLRARLVASPEQWRWSSTQGRVGGAGDALVAAERPLAVRDVEDWLAYLAQGLSEEECDAIRRHSINGRALGDAAFIARIEAVTGVSQQRRPSGRPERWRVVP